MSDLCLRPGSRLRCAPEFDRVFAKPTRQSSEYFTILSRPGREPQARLGLAISKRVDKRAVGRNRIKRLVRESFRHQQQELKGLDLVVMARPLARQAENQALTRSLHKLWRRLAAQH